MNNDVYEKNDEQKNENEYEVLTVNDVSKILKISKCNTYKLFKLNLFPSYKINNKMFVTKKSFDKWFYKLDNKNIVL